MVKGRMPRETNPVPGEIPGFVSNFDTTGNEDYERVSPHNPYPVGNYIKQGSLWVPVSNENPVPTQLTGSILVEQKLISDVSIGPQNFLILGSYDSSKFEEFYVAVDSDSGHNFRVDVTPLSEDNTTLVETTDRKIINSEGKRRLPLYENAIEALTTRFRVIIYNDSMEEHVYSAWLFKKAKRGVI